MKKTSLFVVLLGTIIAIFISSYISSLNLIFNYFDYPFNTTVSYFVVMSPLMFWIGFCMVYDFMVDIIKQKEAKQ